MQQLNHFITTYLDPIGIVIGLVVAIPIVLTFYEVVIGRKRRYKQYLKAIRKQPGERKGVIIIDLLPGKEIRPAVENYCQQHEALKDIPKERYFHISYQGLSKKDIDAFKQTLREQSGNIFAQGIDHLHYFHAGPSTAAAMVGAELSNGCSVFLYQHEGNTYTDFGLLQLPILP